jgi:hypothetical protein
MEDERPLATEGSLPDVYPGVDLVCYGTQRRFEYDFVVTPGADVRAVRLAFEGARAYS